MSKLILFDIDGTLVLTGGAGGRAMSSAFQHVFGVAHPDSVAMDGRTDPWVVAQMAAQCGLTCDGETLQRFHDVYITHLSSELHHPGPRKGILPGVSPLLDTLVTRTDVFPALLTGNFRQGARLKLQYFDLWKYFRCGAFGDDAMDRVGLVAIAVREVQACGGPAVDPADIVVIGDTPLDVAAASAAGARSVAVATGRYDVAALEASGATVAFDDLTDLDAVLQVLEL